MCTYRRFTCVERSIQFFLNQDYQGERELIIYNTDTEYPLELSPELKNKNITIINNNTDYLTKKPYNNIGAIRRDSLKHANGEYYICWDDDDIFLPWNIRQCMDGLKAHPNAWSWKPHRSMFWKTNHEPALAGNVMEASIISRLDKILEFGFDPHQGGGEHLAWETAFRKHKKLIVDRNSIPAYCFNWADQGEMRGHKQSGTYGKEDNFEHHKKNTKDHARRPLGIFSNDEIQRIYQSHIKVIKENAEKDLGEKHNNYIIKQELIDKYMIPDFKYSDFIRKQYSLSGIERYYIDNHKPDRKGFFFECGAHDGIHMSQTYTLESEYKWKGILVECHRGLFSLLKDSGRESILVNQCIGLPDAKSYFLEKSKGHVGHSQLIEDPDVDVSQKDLISVNTKSVEQILIENHAPKIIDYMIIDVEDSYETAIQGIDFENRDIRFLAIEMNVSQTKIIDYITSKGFTLIKQIQTDFLFKKNDIEN